MYRTALQAYRRLPRQGKSLLNAQLLRQTATKATVASSAASAVVVTDPANDGHRNLVLGGLLAAMAAGLAWDHQQQKKAIDCCGIIGVVAHPKFDVR